MCQLHIVLGVIDASLHKPSNYKTINSKLSTLNSIKTLPLLQLPDSSDFVLVRITHNRTPTPRR